MDERFDDRLVRIVQADVFAHQGDGYLALGILVAGKEVFPLVQIEGIGARKIQVFQYHTVQMLRLHQDRHIIDGLGIDGLHHGFLADIAEQGQFCLHLVRQGMFRATNQHVGLHTGLHQRLDGVLHRFGLQFAGGSQVRHQSEVDDDGIVRTQIPLELTDGLDVRQGFDVADRTAYLGNDDIVFTCITEYLDTLFDLVGDVRDYLHGLAQKLTAALLFDDRKVNAAGGYVVGLGGFHIEKTLVMPQVEIRFRSVGSHVAFAMFVRVERTGIHIDIGIEFLDGYFVPSGLKKTSQRGRNDAFPQRGSHPSGDENVFCFKRHGMILQKM